MQSTVHSRWCAMRPCVVLGLALGLLFYGLQGRLGDGTDVLIWFAAVVLAGWLCAYRLRAHHRDPWLAPLGAPTMAVIFALGALGVSLCSLAACLLLLK